MALGPRSVICAPLFACLVVACGSPLPAASRAACAPGSAAASTAAANAPPAMSASPSCLSIVSWNDMHGQLAPDDVQIDTGRVFAGGVVAVAERVAAIRATGDAVVVLDAGDLFTGPYASTVAEGAPIIDAYNAMGVDAAAIGNHEFDFGPVGYGRVMAAQGVGDEAGADGPRGALFARMTAAHFPFVSANIHRDGGKALDWPNVHPSVHVARGGFDVGVVGYSTIETPTTTLMPNVVGLDFKSGRAEAVAVEVRALRASGASPVVLLAHASLEGELPQLLDDPKDPQGQKRTGEIADLLDAIPIADRPDIVIAGHRHAWLLGRVRGVPIVSTDQHGVGLARIRFCRAQLGALPVLTGIERRVAMAIDPPSSPLAIAVTAAVAPWRAKVAAEESTVIATLPKSCAQNALDGTAMAEQVARALAEAAGDAAATPTGVPVVGIVNSGSLRAPLHAGRTTFADLFTTSPFENSVAVCATTREGLAHLIDNSLQGRSVSERFPFGISGAKATFARGAEGALTRRGLEIVGAAHDADPVWLVVPDFVLWGGDGLLEGVTCTKTATSSTRMRDAWRRVLAREQACDGAPKNIVIR